MGCKGSKHDVAAGSTTLKSRILRRKSEASKSCSNSNSIAQTDQDDKAEKLVRISDGKNLRNGRGQCEKLQPAINVKDIGVNTEGRINGALEEYCGDGSASPESPDQYFSPKKGEESAGDLSGYHSSHSPPEEDGGRREEGSSTSKGVEFTEVEKIMEGGEVRHLVDKNVIEAKGEEDVKTSDNPSANVKEPTHVMVNANSEIIKMKEPTLVYNKANSDIIIANNANHVGEITEGKESDQSSSTKDQSIIKQMKKNDV